MKISGLIHGISVLFRNWIIPILLFWLLAGTGAQAQFSGDYGSASAGPSSWTNASSWIVCVTPGSWVGATPAATAPANDKNIWIRSGHVINLNSDRLCNNLTIETGGLLNGNDWLAVYGNLTVNGTINSSNSLRFYGVILSGSGFINPSEFRLYSTNKTIHPSTNLIIDCNVEFNTSGLTITNNGTVYIRGGILTDQVSIFGTWTNASGSYLGLTGNISPNNVMLNASALGNRVEYNSSSNQTIKSPSLGYYYHLTTSNGGTKTLSSNITILGDLYIKSSSTLSVSGSNHTITSEGNWIHENNGVFNENNGLVIFTGNRDQTISGNSNETFHNLAIDKIAGSVQMTTGDINITNQLTLANGNITFSDNNFSVILNAGSPGSLIYTSTTGSRIIGKFERRLSSPGSFLFPVGTVTNYNPLNISPVNLGAGYLLSEFIESDPGDAGLPVTDAGVEVAESFPDGYWSLTARPGFSSTNFNISLDGTGFASPVYASTRIIKRTAGGDWNTDGNHVDASGNVCYRNNLTGNISTSGTHFGFGRSRPVITDQPDNSVKCAGTNASFTIVASGSGTLTYKWYKSPDIALSEGGRFTGTGQATLNISDLQTGDAGSYYCIVTDQHSSTRQSNSAILTVNPAPGITIGSVSQVCNTSGSFNLPYSSPVNLPVTYSIGTGTPAMTGFTAVTDAALVASPLLVNIPSGATENDYQFTVTVKNALGCVSDPELFTVTVNENQVADAGEDKAVCGSLSTLVEAGTPSKGSGSWSYVSGPDATPSFGNATIASSSVSVGDYGDYEFNWKVTNESCETNDLVTITFWEAPVGTATPDEDRKSVV